MRRRQPIYDGGLATLRRFTDDVKEVRAGLECGIKLGDYSEYLPEDIIECYTLEKVPQQLLTEITLLNHGGRNTEETLRMEARQNHPRHFPSSFFPRVRGFAGNRSSRP